MTTILCSSQSSRRSVIEAWMDDNRLVDRENWPNKRRRTTLEKRASNRHPLQKLEPNMSNAGRDRQNTAAGRSGGRRKSPRKRLVEQEEVVQAGTTPAIHSSLPIPPDPDIEQERVFHRGISGQAESSSVLEQPLSTSSYTKALSLQNRSARGGPGSLKSQPNGSSSPVKSSTTLRRLPKPVIYGQLRKTSGLTHVSNLCHDLDSIIKVRIKSHTDP